MYIPNLNLKKDADFFCTIHVSDGKATLEIGEPIGETIAISRSYPITQVPLHGRLVDADEAERAGYGLRLRGYGGHVYFHEFSELPTVIPATDSEVRDILKEI